MAELPYFQFYPADYLRDTEILTLSAQGGWTRMLCSMWHPSRRGVLSLRLQAMARLLHASEEATKSIIEEIEDCGVGDVEWGNDGRVSVTCRRMVRDWEAAEAKRQALSEAGRKGGKAKRKPPPSPAKATLEPGLSEAKAKAEARSQKPEDLSKSSSPPPQSPPAGGGGEPEPDAYQSRFVEPEGGAAPLAPFDQFWAGLPPGCKIGKDAARRAWAKAVKRAGGHEPILAGLPGYRAYEKKRSQQADYRPLHPSTWLNGGRWEDEHEPEKPDDTNRPLL